MKKSRLRLSRNRTWFLGSAVLACVGFGAYLYGVALPRERFEAEQRWRAVLTAMADDRKMAIERWVAEGRSDARTIAGIGQVVDRLQGGSRCDDACLARLLRNYSDGHEGNPVWILDARSATVASVGPSVLDRPVRETNARAGIALFEAGGKVWVLSRFPVRDAQGEIGSIALIRDPAVFLFPFLRLQALTSRTAEALLLERRGAAAVNFSPLRKPPYRTLALRREAAQEPLLPEGRPFRRATDYADMPVFDVTRPIAGTNWALSVKADRDEVYADVWPGLRAQLAAFVALLSVVSTLGVYLVRSREAARLRELQLSSERLFQSQKAEAIGRLAGGVAHDFNNTLNVILGHTDQAMRGLDEADPRRRNLVEIRKGTEQAASLTQQLLAFSRRQVLQPRVLDFNRILLDMEKTLRPPIGDAVELELALAADACYVLADPGQVQQVILNLVVNGRDAMPAGGHLSLATAHANVPDPADPLRYEILPPGDYVRFSVSDDGVGMSADVKAHVFEPFFTTKEVGKGTGLGLSTVYGIVKQSGGFVFVESLVARGTTIHVFLPRTEPVAAPESRSPVDSRLGGECVLLVEDNDALRELTRETLDYLGYRVLEAPDGPAALEIVRGHSGALDLLLTDVVMPRMEGPELARQIVALLPGIKVLYISGYSADAVGVDGILAAGLEFLQKPFTADALAAKIREVLEKR